MRPKRISMSAAALSAAMAVSSCGSGQSTVVSPAAAAVEDAGPTTESAPGTILSPDAGTTVPIDAGPRGGGGRAREPGRSPEDIRALVVAHRDEARACYDASLPIHPGIEGNLVMRWTIDPKGSVTQVMIDPARSQIMEPTLVACVAGILQQIQFAPSARGFETTAHYPFNFHPRRSTTSTAPSVP
jgi:hypothetical protein